MSGGVLKSDKMECSPQKGKSKRAKSVRFSEEEDVKISAKFFESD